MAEANAQEMPKFGHNKVKASKSYNMKAGDIMVCYGSNPMGTLIGHAAIAYDSQNILEMPGYSYSSGVKKTSKADFFKKYSSNGKYVNVYRLSNSSYASDAADYAYNNMYLKNKPTYSLYSPNFKSYDHRSFCSNYVIRAYLFSNSKSVKTADLSSTNGLVAPHDLPLYFNSINKLTNITSY